MADSELLDLVKKVAQQAKAGEQIEVYASRVDEVDVRAFDGEIESLSSSSAAGVGIRVVTGGKQGFAHAGALDEALIAATLDDARDNASFATPDDNVGLAVPDGLVPVVLDLWDPDVETLPTSSKIQLALDLEKRVRQGDRRIRQVVSADYGDMMGESAIATSTGINATTRRTICSLSVSAIAGDDEERHTGVGFGVARGPSGVDPEEIADDAIERATRLIGAKKIPSSSCTVVLDRRVASTLLAVISGALSGEAVTKSRSMFAGRVGELVGTTELTLVDDPTDFRSLGASQSDAEGLACRRNTLIENGHLLGFVYDTTSARRAGTTSTGSAVRGGYATTPTAGCRAVSIAKGAGDLDQADILKLVGDGLFVQSISGVHSGVNSVSGDFSVGVEGLLIKGGELAQPVHEVTIASTLQRMMLSLVLIGNDLEWLPGTAAAQTLAIEGMSLSGS
ncbi:MAG: TldD/PmbA family protein [Acidimicrobiales bacterium]